MIFWKVSLGGLVIKSVSGSLGQRNPTTSWIQPGWILSWYLAPFLKIWPKSYFLNKFLCVFTIFTRLCIVYSAPFNRHKIECASGGLENPLAKLDSTFNISFWFSRFFGPYIQICRQDLYKNSTIIWPRYSATSFRCFRLAVCQEFRLSRVCDNSIVLLLLTRYIDGLIENASGISDYAFSRWNLLFQFSWEFIVATSNCITISLSFFSRCCLVTCKSCNIYAHDRPVMTRPGFEPMTSCVEVMFKCTVPTIHCVSLT